MNADIRKFRKKKIWNKWSSGGDKMKIIFLPNELTELFYRK